MTLRYVRTSEAMNARLRTDGEWHAFLVSSADSGFEARFNPDPESARRAVLTIAERESRGGFAEACRRCRETGAPIAGWSLVVWHAGDAVVDANIEHPDTVARRAEFRERGIAANAVRWGHRSGPAGRVAVAMLEAIPDDGRWHPRCEVFEATNRAFRFETDGQLRKAARVLVAGGAIESALARDLGFGTNNARFVRRTRVDQ